MIRHYFCVVDFNKFCFSKCIVHPGAVFENYVCLVNADRKGIRFTFHEYSFCYSLMERRQTALLVLIAKVQRLRKVAKGSAKHTQVPMYLFPSFYSSPFDTSRLSGQVCQKPPTTSSWVGLREVKTSKDKCKDK